jgi:tetratricopeptide (TPR) repeat protein
MFETVLKIMVSISQKKPLVLFLDDVHWADTASLHLMHYLARNITNQNILILCAYRTEELDCKKSQGAIDSLQEIITRLGSENLFNTIELERLNQNESFRIVNSLLDVKNVPQEFASLIYNETEGNPFFIKEVLKTLIEDGALTNKNGKLKLNISHEDIVIPVSIKDLIKLRLQKLDDVSLDVLEYASVIGNEFPLELLNNIIDIPESKLINILSNLTDAKFINDIQTNEGFTYEYTHNKIHEVIYKDLNDVKKKMIHLRLAKYLEDAKIDNIEEVVYDLAYHFYYGLDFDRALSYSIEGGEKAMRTYANKEALDLYNIGLNSLRRLDEKLANTTHYKEKKIEILSKLGALNKTFGDWDKSLAYYEQLLPLCEEIKAVQTKAAAFVDIGWIYQQRNLSDEAEKYFNKSLEIAEKIKDEQLAAEAYNGLGTVYESQGSFQKALDSYTISRKFAEKSQDLVNLAKAHNAFGRIYNLQGNHKKARKHNETSIYIFEKLNDLPELAKAYSSLGMTYYDMGNLKKNIEFNERCIELADQISDIRVKGYGLSNTVDALVKSNQLDLAEEYATSALQIFSKLDEQYMVALNHINFGIIFKQKKEWNKSVSHFKIAIEYLENLNVPYKLAECYNRFAEVYKSKGESVKAKYYQKKAKQLSKSCTDVQTVSRHFEDVMEKVW